MAFAFGENFFSQKSVVFFLPFFGGDGPKSCFFWLFRLSIFGVA